MNSRHRPTETIESDGKVKKSYCDKQFKRNLVKGLKIVNCEPDNIEKLRGNKHLQKYTEERIINYVNSLSADVQRNVDLSVEEEDEREVLKLANMMDSIAGNEQKHEIPLVIKLKSETDEVSDACATNNINFKALHKFIYSAVSGYPDFIDLDESELTVLASTHRMLLEQIEHDATPKFLEELKSKICAGYHEETHPGVAELSEIFQDKHLNPLNFPFEYFLNGTLPEHHETVVKKEVKAQSLKKKPALKKESI